MKSLLISALLLFHHIFKLFLFLNYFLLPDEPNYYCTFTALLTKWPQRESVEFVFNCYVYNTTIIATLLL